MQACRIENYLIFVILSILLLGGCASQSVYHAAPALDGDGFIPEDAYYNKEVFYGTTRVPKCNERYKTSTVLTGPASIILTGCR